MVASAPVHFQIATASCRLLRTAVSKLHDMPLAVSGRPVKLFWPLYCVAVSLVILMPTKLAGAVCGLIRARTSSLTYKACAFHADGLRHNFVGGVKVYCGVRTAQHLKHKQCLYMLHAVMAADERLTKNPGFVKA